jgi:DNA-binding transcriptional MerR regulator
MLLSPMFAASAMALSSVSLSNALRLRAAGTVITTIAMFIRLGLSPRHDLGFPIEEIGKLMALWRDRTPASAEVKGLALAPVEELKKKARDLRGMRRTLEELARSCHGDARPDCPIMDKLATAPVQASARDEP